MNVTFIGLDKALRDIKDYSDGVGKKAINAINTTALNVQGKARRATPVDTGRLRSSIAIEAAKMKPEAFVATNVEYAPHVEFGTRYQRSQPYLFPAAESERNAHKARLAEALKP